MSFPHAFSGNLCVQSVDSRLIRAGMTGGLNGYSIATQSANKLGENEVTH